MKLVNIIFALIILFNILVYGADQKTVGRIYSYPDMINLNTELDNIYYNLNKRGFNADNIHFHNEMRDNDNDTIINTEESTDEDKIRFDTGGTERVMIDSSGLTIGTSGNSYDIITYDVTWSTQAYKIEVISGILTATAL